MPRLTDSERERIIGEIGVGTNVREVANRHNVHVSKVYRLMNKFVQNGDVIDRQRSGHHRPPALRTTSSNNSPPRSCSSTSISSRPIQNSCFCGQNECGNSWKGHQWQNCEKETSICGTLLPSSTQKAIFDGVPPPSQDGMGPTTSCMETKGPLKSPFHRWGPHVLSTRQ